MKLIERSAERLVFGLGARERTFLERLLSYYPIAPESSQPLTRESRPELAEAEALLHESLREQKQELTGWLRLHLCEGEALRRTSTGWRLTLEGSEFERLLQVLNELRVGAWSRLGSPEVIDSEELANGSETAQLHAIMTLAGQFQMVLLHALEADSGAGPAPGPAPEPGAGGT